jgi:hypothetical protein
MLNALCETPIIQVPYLRYDIQFTYGSALLNISSAGQVEDDDMTLITIRLMDPNMLVAAWEALILERKVLVISSVPSAVRYCCEFLRRLVHPLVVVNTYIPFLHRILLNTIEAPFPYLVGAESKTIYESDVDLSDTVVVDLDRKTVTAPSSGHHSGGAPESLKQTLINEIANIIVAPLANWVSRTSDKECVRREGIDKNSMEYHDFAHPHTLQSQRNCTSAIIECFIRANLSILSSRACEVRAFFRFPDNPIIANRLRFAKDKSRRNTSSVGSMGFAMKRGVYCGCVQLIIENSDIEYLQFVACWMEIDSIRISVYEHADEIALLNIFTKNIEAISPSASEPEGHVFEIQVKGSTSAYKFASTDPDARREWINIVEKFIDKSSKDNNKDVVRPQTLDKAAINALNSPVEKARTLSRSGSECGEEHNEVDELEFSSPRGNYRNSLSMTPMFSKSSNSVLDSEQSNDESKIMNEFRSNVLQSQMFSYFAAKSEFEDFETVLRPLGVSIKTLTEDESGLTSGVVLVPSNQTDSEVDLNTLNLADCPEKDIIADIEHLWGIYVSKDILLTSNSSESQSNPVMDKSTPDEISKKNSTTTSYLRQTPEKERDTVAFLLPGNNPIINRQGRRFSAGGDATTLSSSPASDSTVKPKTSSRSLFSAVMSFGRPSPVCYFKNYLC